MKLNKPLEFKQQIKTKILFYTIVFGVTLKEHPHLFSPSPLWNIIEWSGHLVLLLGWFQYSGWCSQLPFSIKCLSSSLQHTCDLMVGKQFDFYAHKKLSHTYNPCYIGPYVWRLHLQDRQLGICGDPFMNKYNTK